MSEHSADDVAVTTHCETRPRWRVWAYGQSPQEPPSPFAYACDEHLPEVARAMLDKYAGDYLDLDEGVLATHRCAHALVLYQRLDGRWTAFDKGASPVQPIIQHTGQEYQDYGR